MSEDIQPALLPPTSIQSPSLTYQVRLAGILDESWNDWFDGTLFTYDMPANETILTGSFADQSALHGLLGKIRDLGLNLIELRRVPRHGKS